MLGCEYESIGDQETGPESGSVEHIHHPVRDPHRSRPPVVNAFGPATGATSPGRRCSYGVRHLRRPAGVHIAGL